MSQVIGEVTEPRLSKEIRCAMRTARAPRQSARAAHRSRRGSHYLEEGNATRTPNEPFKAGKRIRCPESTWPVIRRLDDSVGRVAADPRCSATSLIEDRRRNEAPPLQVGGKQLEKRQQKCQRFAEAQGARSLLMLIAITLPDARRAAIYYAVESHLLASLSGRGA